MDVEKRIILLFKNDKREIPSKWTDKEDELLDMIERGMELYNAEYYRVEERELRD